MSRGSETPVRPSSAQPRQERAGDEAVGINVFAPAFQTTQASRQEPYHFTREEILKGLANRFVHSSAYLKMYLTMTLFSLVTVVMSLMQACPGTAFYLLEMIVNAALVAEVGIRLTAFGKVRHPLRD